MCNGAKLLFQSGAMWSSFVGIGGRPHCDTIAILEKHLSVQDQWTDSVKVFQTAGWTGEGDLEIATFADPPRSKFGFATHTDAACILEIFLSILQVMQQNDAEGHQLIIQKRMKEIKQREGEAPEKEKQRNELSEVTAVHDGDITDEVFKDADAAEKRRLCKALNREANKLQERRLAMDVAKAAAAVIRQRLAVVENVAAAKSWMESCSKDGAKARIYFWIGHKS